MKKNKRMIIYAKDIQNATGRSYRQSLRLLQKAKQKVGKSKDDMLSLREFCDVYNINPLDFQESI
ncbi:MULTISPECIES: hypothetical protein [Empedobacter]|uniref:XRE family transcriptional regulator n=1 Tax=Empedobacter stercoris TaxID=1628248 RepID=A0ABX1WP31_9FLAO|nr:MULTISPECIES: hypothetical protein [Empedobacter]MCA4777877.1 hypothetical protein [Empedobacter stercoris]MDM1139024.1 hypothetical protein [Empedobacter sp. R132-2]NOJ76362.1 hypothetical protein [Empedobacter stercoris]